MPDIKPKTDADKVKAKEKKKQPSGDAGGKSAGKVSSERGEGVSGSVMEELFAACTEGDLERVQKVLDEHPLLHINYANELGETALHAAASGGHIYIVQFLAGKQALLNVANRKGETALHMACRTGNMYVISFLCHNRLDLNKRNELGETPLHLAVQAGHAEAVEYLRLAGADVNIQNLKGCTALHIACQKRHTTVAHILLHLGCRMDLVDHMDEMALHDACREGLLSVVQTMCAYGCPVDMENKSGMSPLHLAAKTGNAEIVRCLLLSNADMDKQNKDGVRAEDIAIAQGHTDIADMLSYLTSSLTRDKREPFIQQLLPSSKPLSRIIIKVLGSSGVGKSTLIESLKCGYIMSLFRKASQLAGYGTLPAVKPLAPVNTATKKQTNGGAEDGKEATDDDNDDITKPETVPLSTYTKGIHIQQCVLNEVGDVSLWEFSSYEPYLSIYGRFVGNTNTIYLVVVSMKDSLEERTRQLNFWLNYIRTRVTPTEPIGPGGLHQWAPQVAVIATHADVGGCTKNASGEWETEKIGEIMKDLQFEFNSELMLVQRMFLLDASQPMSIEMRYLRVALTEMKTVIVQGLPASLGILDPTVSDLVNWNKSLTGFPVISWKSFAEYIRTKVNLLATDDHLKELLCQLHLIGEAIPMNAGGKEVKVVLNPQWLGSEFLGPLMSYENIHGYPSTGRLTSEHLKSIYPNYAPSDVAELLDLMNICTVYRVNGEPQCDFPCLNYIEEPENVWGEEGTDVPEYLTSISAKTVCGGLRVTVPPGQGSQFIYIFADIQQSFQRQLLIRRDGYRMCQWRRGFRVTYEGLAAVISLVDKNHVIMMRFRGPIDQRDQLFAMQEYLCEILYTAVEESSPGLYLERSPLSVHDLRKDVQQPTAYNPSEVFTACLDGKDKVEHPEDSKTNEKLIDLVAYGSKTIHSAMVFGPDLHVSYLSLYTRAKLAFILDEPNKPGKDWAALATKFDLPQDRIARLNVGEEAQSQSKTDRLLALWSRNPAATVRLLKTKLEDIDRGEDAGGVLSNHAPLFFYTPPKQADTDAGEAGSAATGSASASGGLKMGVAKV